MKRSEKIKKFLQMFHTLDIAWPVYGFIILYLLLVGVVFSIEWPIGLLLLLFIILVIYYFYSNAEKFIRSINQVASEISISVRDLEEDALLRSPIGVLMYNENKRVSWVNPAMQRLFGTENILGKEIDAVNDMLSEFIKVDEGRKWEFVEVGEFSYKVQHQVDRNALYVLDVTEEASIHKSRQNDMVVFGLLHIDDYDEIIESMTDSQMSEFDADLIKRLSKWANEYDIYLKRLDNERFIMLLNQRVLNELEKDKFSFFDRLREYNFERNVPISISIGIAYPKSVDEDYGLGELANQAQVNLDLALGRGGDQIVVRSIDGRARFYGGKRNHSEKRTNVRSKLVYQALMSMVQQVDFVLISGHKWPDTDSIGSAIGLHRLIRQQGIPVKILIDESQLNVDIQKLLSLEFFQEHYNDLFVSEENAEKLLTKRSVIAMVDHSRPSISQAENLLPGRDVVIIDHHRRSEEFPENVVLTYIDPYASSASELVTEFYMNVHYTEEAINHYEATALLAGIIVDTNNFSSRTGSRTFDAASYLKSRGADTEEIQRILKEDIDTLLAKNKLIEATEIFDTDIAITYGKDDHIYDNIIAAQTADNMLKIKDIEASFVIYRRSEEVVGISARSLGKINVQTIMEKMGGGGHLSGAATQIKEKTVEEVFQELLNVLEIDQEGK